MIRDEDVLTLGTRTWELLPVLTKGDTMVAASVDSRAFSCDPA